MSHTPGPWATAIVDHGELKQVETIHAPAVQYGRTMFKIVQPGGIWGRSLAECDANARLIAAAPDLLAELEIIHANAAESPEWIRRHAAAAIAKAKGESDG